MAKFELKNHVFPIPRDYTEDGEVRIGGISNAPINIITKEKGDLIDSARDTLSSALLNVAASKITDDGYPVTLSIDKRGKKPEGYTVTVTEEGARVVGNDAAGLFYGAITLSKLIFVSGDSVYIDKATIKDYPELKMRGAFIESRHNDYHTLADYLEMVDYYADLKVNMLEISIYGCWPTQFDGIPSECLYVPIKGHPELKTPKQIKYYSAKRREWVYRENVLPTMFEEDFFGEVIAYGKKKNIEVYPLFNSFGHNSVIPRLIPEISAKDINGNPTNVGYCTKNPKTLEFIYSVYDEIVDRYLAPNGVTTIEIALDEVYPLAGFDPANIYGISDPWCKCERCRGIENTDIVLEFTIKLIKYLKSRGMKTIYIAHDMFFEHNMINEDMVKRFKDEDIYDVTVLDWWSYYTGERFFRGRSAEVTNIFRSNMKPWNGYGHWSCYCDAWPNIKEAAQLAKKLGFESMTCYTAYDLGFDLSNKYYTECCWAMDGVDEDEFKERYFASEFPDYPEDAHDAWDRFEEVSNHYYETNGLPRIQGVGTLLPHSYLNIPPVTGADPKTYQYPRFFANEAGNGIYAKKREHTLAMRKRMEKAGALIAFLNSDKSTPSATAERMKLSADTHRLHTDIYYTLMRITDMNAKGECTNSYAISEIKRLIRGIDAHIYLIESVKMETHHPTACRLVSKTRLYLTEELAKFEAAEERGETYKYDVRTAQTKTSGLYFLG